MIETQTAMWGGTHVRGATSALPKGVPCVPIALPPSLRHFIAGRATVEVEADTVRGALTQLGTLSLGLDARLCDGDGNPRRAVNIYVNQTDIRLLDNLDTVLEDGAALDIRVSTRRR